MTRLSLICLLLVIISVKSELFTDEDNARLPPLFHLDDYDRCLRQENGLYCLGVFELSPIEPSPVYDLIQSYSSIHYSFNRSRLHRGYCVSTRCPSERSERNSTLRFERCVDERAKQFALSARLHTLHYCTTQEERKAKAVQPPDSAQQLFLQVVYAILVLNVLGTVYDFAMGDNKEKNEILTSWSIRSSWRRLLAVYDDGDPRLKALEPTHGLRVFLMLAVIFIHNLLLSYQYFVINPAFLENVLGNLIFLLNSSLNQVFVILSTFLTAYNILIFSGQHELSITVLPVLVIKRAIRIAPLHLLAIGYAATWWPQARSGPLSGLIEEESKICQQKFWSHAFFLNNVVMKHDTCLAPTWYIPADMHIFILACILTIVMNRRRQYALRVYVVLFFISTALCGAYSYFTGVEPLISILVPDNVRGIFKTTKSYWGYYTSSLALLPACFAGLFTAHLHLELQEKKYNYAENKWLTRLHHWSFPMVFVWNALLGLVVMRYNQSSVMTALHVALDRPSQCCFFFFWVFGIINVDGPLRRIASWRGWRVSARLSLSLMLAHWLINAVISARPVAYHVSILVLCSDLLAVVIYAHLAALAMSLLVEIPVQRFFAKILI